MRGVSCLVAAIVTGDAVLVVVVTLSRKREIFWVEFCARKGKSSRASGASAHVGKGHVWDDRRRHLTRLAKSRASPGVRVGTRGDAKL